MRERRMCLRRPRDDGVSGVVAAALGVVLISVLLAMVVTFWVPAWGYDSELAHSREVVNAFGQFKNAVELQSLAGNANVTVTTTFPLGVGGVPLFGAETAGALSFQYLEGGKIRFRANLTDAQGHVNLSAAGSLEYTIINRYFVPQTIAYESGGVLVDQREASVMRLPPTLRVVNGTQGLEVTVSLVTLEGTPKIVAGVDSHVVSTRLTASNTLPFSWSTPTTLNLTVVTSFEEGWARFFNDTANGSGLDPAAYNVSLPASQDPYTVTLKLYNVRTLTVTVALASLRID